MKESFDYLASLTEIEKKNSPKSFFYEGKYSLLESGRRVSVVGSRKISELGIKRAEKVSKFLVNAGITIVSGLAEGVDTIAHETAIKEGGNTIAVIGTPLNQYYPKKNKQLQDLIAKEHLLISQFPDSFPVTPKNFPIRNRLMALISDATIIIEASEKSGTKHQGWEALRLGRTVFIMENVIKDSSISWAQEMIKYGAEILTNENFKDLLFDLPFLTTKEEYEF
ncbi:DNA-processing protein DprA (plasmid) [Chryseobacterium sp. JJR-5R]|uniref:DNA-processing protein DprA n=1 Tax=Chryseobacterium sp. JJR-5R TaxID=3093923 RepID=UPI002A7483DB|nr:DNA-processing protein DprA [Chryseobacterium sp. JJR-5R]WPO84599.1 DNA-processing protein DprA [Chryseobacterium sp. JJR-5R]